MKKKSVSLQGTRDLLEEIVDASQSVEKFCAWYHERFLGENEETNSLKPSEISALKKILGRKRVTISDVLEWKQSLSGEFDQFAVQLSKEKILQGKHLTNSAKNFDEFEKWISSLTDHVNPFGFDEDGYSPVFAYPIYLGEDKKLNQLSLTTAKSLLRLAKSGMQMHKRVSESPEIVVMEILENLVEASSTENVTSILEIYLEFMEQHFSHKKELTKRSLSLLLEHLERAKPSYEDGKNLYDLLYRYHYALGEDILRAKRALISAVGGKLEFRRFPGDKLAFIYKRKIEFLPASFEEKGTFDLLIEPDPDNDGKYVFRVKDNESNKLLEVNIRESEHDLVAALSELSVIANGMSLSDLKKRLYGGLSSSRKDSALYKVIERAKKRLGGDFIVCRKTGGTRYFMNPEKRIVLK